MRIAIKCKTCENKHLDHYECSKCRANLGYVINPKFKYCPYCGEKLLDEKRNRNNSI